MADISKVSLNGDEYDVKDATAREYLLDPGIQIGASEDGSERGVYDETDGEWMLYRDSSGYDHFKKDYVSFSSVGNGSGSGSAYRVAPGIWVGTGVWTASAGTSLAIFTNSDISSYFETGNSYNNQRTFIGAMNGDASAQSVHVDGVSVKSETLYATFNGTANAGNFRINFVIIRY